MRVVASDPALQLIHDRGGRLFVWVKNNRCCTGGIRTLVTAYAPPDGLEFRQVEESLDIDLFLPSRLSRVPDELHLEQRRFPRRVEAYWEGCAWIV